MSVEAVMVGTLYRDLELIGRSLEGHRDMLRGFAAVLAEHLDGDPGLAGVFKTVADDLDTEARYVQQVRARVRESGLVVEPAPG